MPIKALNTEKREKTEGDEKCRIGFHFNIPFPPLTHRIYINDEMAKCNMKIESAPCFIVVRRHCKNNKISIVFKVDGHKNGRLISNRKRKVSHFYRQYLFAEKI